MISPPRSTGSRLAAATAVLSLALTGVVAVTTAAPAQAHGNVNDPISRNYRCLEVWGSQHLNPAMASQDPMCWQAWQADPNAMWNWNGLLRDGLGGRHRELIPDGTICSGGGADNGRYNALDTPGDWVATPKPATFRLNLVDQASHGADFIDVYISKDGYDPLTERLAWDDLALVGRTEYTRDGGIVSPKVNGTAYGVDVDASAYPGRRVIMTLWKASHSDQMYFLCSDVVIGAGAAPSAPAPPAPAPPAPAPPAPAPPAPAPPAPAPPAPAPPATPGTPSTVPSTTATSAPAPMPASPPAGSAGCTATISQNTSWPGGLQNMVVVTAGSRPITNWHVMWTMPEGQQVTHSWNAEPTRAGDLVMFDSVAYNGRLAAGESATFGYLGSWTVTAALPTQVTCSAG